jgi:hypothetical protein
MKRPTFLDSLLHKFFGVREWRERSIQHDGGMIMAQTPHSKLNLQRMTEQRNELRALLQDAYDIILAQGDSDREAWLGQARVALAEAAVMA